MQTGHLRLTLKFKHAKDRVSTHQFAFLPYSLGIVLCRLAKYWAASRVRGLGTSFTVYGLEELTDTRRLM